LLAAISSAQLNYFALPLPDELWQNRATAKRNHAARETKFA
jgi:hypothetical protein